MYVQGLEQVVGGGGGVGSWVVSENIVEIPAHKMHMDYLSECISVRVHALSRSEHIQI